MNGYDGRTYKHKSSLTLSSLSLYISPSLFLRLTREFLVTCSRVGHSYVHTRFSIDGLYRDSLSLSLSSRKSSLYAARDATAYLLSPSPSIFGTRRAADREVLAIIRRPRTYGRYTGGGVTPERGERERVHALTLPPRSPSLPHPPPRPPLHPPVLLLFLRPYVSRQRFSTLLSVANRPANPFSASLRSSPRSLARSLVHDHASPLLGLINLAAAGEATNARRAFSQSLSRMRATRTH